MTVEKALENEIEKAEKLLAMVTEFKPKNEKSYSTWSDVGEAKRFNGLLEEIIEIYRHQQ